MLSAGTASVGEEKWMFELANLMGQCSIDHVLVVPELQSTDVPGLPCGLSPYVQRLPSSIPNIKALPGRAHVAVLVPIHVFPDLIMDDKISTCIHERLCKAQHR